MKEEKDPFALMYDVVFLKTNPIFAEVRMEELKAIAAIARDCVFHRGARIVSEGDPGDSLFLVKKGAIAITKKVGGREVTLATLRETACFGEMVIFDDEPRSASAGAEEECTLMVIEKEDLLGVIRQFPDIAIQLFRVLGGRLRTANEKVKELTSRLEKHDEHKP